MPVVRTCPVTSFFETRSQNTARCHQSYGSYQCLKSKRGQKRRQVTQRTTKSKSVGLLTDGSCGGLPWRIVCRCMCHSQRQFYVSCWRVWDLGKEKCDGSISSSWRSTRTHPDESAGPVPSDSPVQTWTNQHINFTQLSNNAFTLLDQIWPPSWAYIYVLGRCFYTNKLTLHSRYFSMFIIIKTWSSLCQVWLAFSFTINNTGQKFGIINIFKCF